MMYQHETKFVLVLYWPKGCIEESPMHLSEKVGETDTMDEALDLRQHLENTDVRGDFGWIEVVSPKWYLDGLAKAQEQINDEIPF